VTNADRTPGRVPGHPAGQSPAGDADAPWRRPSADTPSLVPPAKPAPPPAPEAYPGPPRAAPPPSNWRPPVVAPTVPPRDMPTQDHDRMDAEERASRTLTQGIGLVAGAIILILFFVLCARIV